MTTPTKPPDPANEPRPHLTLDAAMLSYLIANFTSDWVNGHAPHLPPLRWTLNDDQRGHRRLCGAVPDECSDPQAAAELWAAELNLCEIYSGHGCRKWRGDAMTYFDINDRRPVEVWYISDRDAFMAL